MSAKKKTRKKLKSKAIRKGPPSWIIGAILLMTFLVFSPSLSNEFVNWDDDRNLYENEAVLNLNWDNLVKIFSEDVIGNYNPLSNLALAIQHQLFEDTEFYHAGFHLTNILLHLLCVFLVYKIILGMGLHLRVAVIGTALFAIHPMRVESVTWITEIKDVLYGSFFLGSLYMYLRHLKNGKNVHLIWCFLLFVIGLFAKIQMVILPVALILLDYWQGERSFIKSAIKKWYFFVPSLAFGLLGIFMLDQKGSLDTTTTYNAFERIFIGTYSLVVYLIKSIVPYRLSPLYPYPAQLSIWHYLSVIPALLFFFGLYWTWKKERRVAFFGLSFFFANVVLMLQVLGAGQGYLADRFTYIAYLGLFIVYAYYLNEFWQTTRFRRPAIGLTTAMLGVFCFLTFQQTQIWKNSGTLWTHVLKYYTQSTLPYGNRANFYRDSGQLDAALSDYSSTIRLKPDNAKAYNSRAKLYFARNEDDKALKDYEKAVQLDPDNAEYLINRGAAYAKLGQWNKALADLNQGLKINPRNRNGYLNRSLVYQQLREHQLTLNDLNAYLELDPNNAEIWYEAGRINQIMGNRRTAIQSYSKAISLKENGLFYLERSKSYFQLQDWNNCKADVLKAQQLGRAPQPAYLNALKAQNIL